MQFFMLRIKIEDAEFYFVWKINDKIKTFKKLIKIVQSTKNLGYMFLEIWHNNRQRSNFYNPH